MLCLGSGDLTLMFSSLLMFSTSPRFGVSVPHWAVMWLLMSLKWKKTSYMAKYRRCVVYRGLWTTSPAYHEM